MSEEKSMRDTLEETMTAIEEREEEEQVEEKPEEHSEPDAPEQEEQEEKLEPDSPEPPSAEAKPPEPSAKPDPSLANPPITWKAKAKSQWGVLPDDVKREIRKREQDAISGITQYKEMASYGERISKTIQPYQAFLKARNATPEAVVENALDFAYRLSSGTPQEKGVLLQRIAKQYGADLSVQQTPEQDKLHQVLQPVLNELAVLKQSWQNSQQTERQRQTQTLEQQVVAFAGETDETGALKRPYFEEVKGLMAALLESGQAKQLDDAYALAVKAHPEVSVLVQSEQTLKQGQKKREESQERAEKARRNNQVNFQKRPVQTGKPAPDGSMRDTIEATYARLMQSA